MSDPFDADDDLFADPATLQAIAAIEQQVIASQAFPRLDQPQPPNKKTGYHHTVAPPRSSSRSAVTTSSTSRGLGASGLSNSIPRPAPAPAPLLSKCPVRPPPKVQTEPRVATQTFGFGDNGKFGLPDIQKRAVAYSTSKPLHDRSTQRGVKEDEDRAEDEDEPMDIVMDESGRYGLSGGEGGGGSGEEANEIIDARAQPEIRDMVQNANKSSVSGRALRAGAGFSRSTPFSSQQSQASASRRFIPPSRASTSGTTIPSAAPVPAPPLDLNTRQFGRSVSAGSQIFSRPNNNSLAGPSRIPFLATIPSEGSQGSSSGPGLGGVPPSSQGAAARRTAFELESQKQLVERLQAEIQQLRKNAVAAAAVEVREEPEWRKEVRGLFDNPKPVEEGEQKVKMLQEQLWAAQGEVANARRLQKAEQSKLLAEIEKLRGDNQDLAAQLKHREEEAKYKIQSVKTQAVFTNHNILSSATKLRQQQQSQRPAPPSPFRTSSPAREYESVTPLPISRTLKGKAAGTARPAPRFEGLHNGFNITPQLGTRVKRQRTEGPSPTNSPSRPVSASPLKSSPSKPVLKDESSPAFEPDDGGDVNMDWGGLDDVGAVIEKEVVQERDVRGEFAYHLLHHTYAYPFIYQSEQPTILRLVSHRRQLPPPDPTMTDSAYRKDETDWHREDEFNHEYQAMSGTIVALCGDTSVSYERLAETVLVLLVKMFEMVVEDVNNRRQRVKSIFNGDGFIRSVYIIPHFATLLSSIINLFPDAFTLQPTLGSRLSSALLLLTQMIPITKKSTRLDQLLPMLGVGEELGSGVEWERIFEEKSSVDLIEVCLFADRFEKGVKSRGDSREGEEEVGEVFDGFGDWCKSLIGLAQAICRYGDGAICWPDDRLVELILRWTAQHHNPTIFEAACDLFFTAASRKEYYRVLTSKASIYSSDVPVIDWLSKFLVHPPQWSIKFSTHSTSTSLASILSGTLMLSLADEDAVILIAERSILVPGLLLALERESRKIWGLDSVGSSKGSVLNLLTLALVLLHHLVYPPPLPGRSWTHPQSQRHSTSQQQKQSRTLPNPLFNEDEHSTEGFNPTTSIIPPLDGPQSLGIDLAKKIHEVGMGGNKEFAGLHHVFYTVVGVMAYGELEEWEEAKYHSGIERDLMGVDGEEMKSDGTDWILDLKTIQFLAQDILEAVVEGPEGDQIYELYVEDEMDQGGGMEEVKDYCTAGGLGGGFDRREDPRAKEVIVIDGDDEMGIDDEAYEAAWAGSDDE